MHDFQLEPEEEVSDGEDVDEDGVRQIFRD